MKHLPYLAPLCAALLFGCGGSSSNDSNDDGGTTPDGESDSGTTDPGEDAGDDGPIPTGFEVEPMGQFNEPWAMTFLPDGRLLVTEKSGALKLRAADGTVGDISGVPAVNAAGQGGLGDIILHPDFEQNQMVYLSWVESGGGGTSGSVVARATLALDGEGGGSLEGLERLWEQDKIESNGHFSQKLAFGPDGRLFITSGERQEQDPAQDMTVNLGKIIRLNEDGSLPADNPYQDDGAKAQQFWTIGHRNMYGIAFDADGRLWEHEMGPEGGDELNLIIAGENYGWPIVSNGDNYNNGGEIPDHDTMPQYEAPKEWWTPVISPSSLVIYSGDVYPQWRGHGFIGGLSSEALIRVELGEDTASEAERWPMGERIREVEQGPDGHLWLLEDGGGGRLLKLVPTYE